MISHPFQRLAPFLEDDDDINVVVETPKGFRNKFAFDQQHGFFRLTKVLPDGFAFPFDFGFVPGTKGEDGDPLDVLLLMSEPAFSGCVVRARLIGAIEAQQVDKDGRIQRNDRLVAVVRGSPEYVDMRSLKLVNAVFTANLEHFFAAYHDLDGQKFRILGCCGPKHAKRLVQDGISATHPKSGSSKSARRQKKARLNGRAHS